MANPHVLIIIFTLPGSLVLMTSTVGARESSPVLSNNDNFLTIIVASSVAGLILFITTIVVVMAMILSIRKRKRYVPTRHTKSIYNVISTGLKSYSLTEIWRRKPT